jgi:glycosyltransferase involved in cell wall biosynthesis
MGRPKHARLAPASLDPLQRFRLLEACDGVLGMRLHALVAGLRTGRPVVGLAYDPKVTALMEAAGVGQAAVPPGEWTAEAIGGALAGMDARGGDRLESRQSPPTPSADLAIELIRRGPREAPADTALARRLGIERVREGLRLETELGLQVVRLGQMAEQAALQREDARRVQDYLVAERNRIEYDYWALQGSFGVDLMRRYWRFLAMLAPDGSRRRMLYRMGHRVLRRALSLISLPLGPSAMGRRPQGSGGLLQTGGGLTGPGRQTGSLDARFDLARFYSDRRSTYPAVARAVIFSATQLIESEGQRPTNLAFELAKMGIPVVFCYWRWDRSPWTVQERLAEGIFQFPMDLAAQVPGDLFPPAAGPSLVLFEFPHPDLFRVEATAHASGWVTIYEAIDDWEGFHRVGQAGWYDRAFEGHLAATSDLVCAVNDRLAERMIGLGAREVEVIPNGVPSGIAKVTTERLLPRGDVTVGYFGHLSSSWFDWPLIRSAANARPKWRWYIIGYGADQNLTAVPDNVAVLGKVPQRDLASYAANWDVGVVPFRTGRVASSADAIKIYEYMAMGLPAVVVGAPLPSMPDGLALQARNSEEFLSQIEAAAATKESLRDERIAFGVSSSWENRGHQVLGKVESMAQRVGEKLCVFPTPP